MSHDSLVRHADFSLMWIGSALKTLKPFVNAAPLQRTNSRCGTGTKTQLPHSPPTGNDSLLNPGVLRLRLLEDGNVRVGVFPQR